jgi:hypothetical protein
MNHYSINSYYDNRKLFFGPIAGIVESICMQPLDTMKVLKQSNQYTNAKDLLKTPRVLYKGLGPFTSQMMVKYFLRFTAFDVFKSKNGNMLHNFGAGIAAGFTESLFITPFELVKTNLQTTNNKDASKVIKEIYYQKGIPGLYRGFSTTAIRQCTNQAFNFSIYYKLRHAFIAENEKPSMFQIIPFTLFSSSIGPIVTSPVDTIKTRFMNPKYSYKSIFEAAKDMVKTEGISSFYKGIGLRLLRVCGGQAITFCVVENLLYYT